MNLKGFGFGKIFIVFLIGCIFGTYYEEIWNIVSKIIHLKPLFYEYRRGVLYGPFSPIYGFGAAIMVVTLCKIERPLWKTFLIASLAGGIIEYGLSFLQEKFVGTVSWDYSNQLLNLNGRTTIPFMLFWGLLGISFVYLIYPTLSKWIEKIPDKFGKRIVLILFILFTLDFTISMTALFGQHYRNRNIKSFTIVGKLCDIYYPDEVLSKYYPNMIRKDKK